METPDSRTGCVIVPFNKTPAAELKCSFCARPESKVKKLVKSGTSNHAICDQCIAKAYAAHKDSE